MRSLPRTAEGRPAVELTDLSDDDLMELDGGGHSDAQAAGGAAQPVTATALPGDSAGGTLEPAPAAGDDGAADDAAMLEMEGATATVLPPRGAVDGAMEPTPVAEGEAAPASSAAPPPKPGRGKRSAQGDAGFADRRRRRK